jgi:hypothetical protein
LLLLHLELRDLLRMLLPLHDNPWGSSPQSLLLLGLHCCRDLLNSSGISFADANTCSPFLGLSFRHFSARLTLTSVTESDSSTTVELSPSRGAIVFLTTVGLSFAISVAFLSDYIQGSPSASLLVVATILGLSLDGCQLSLRSQKNGEFRLSLRPQRSSPQYLGCSMLAQHSTASPRFDMALLSSLS